MAERRCSTPGCVKPHRARGLCSTHYNQANAKPIELDCAACGQPSARTNQQNRGRYRPACSMLCRGYLQHGPMFSPVPMRHPSRLSTCVVPLDHPSRTWMPASKPTVDCDWCGKATTRRSYCSLDCRRRAKNVRRRGREADGRTYSWSHVMRVFALLDGCCAYCAQPIVGPPDPDHVVPLSRHGSNGSGNVLPSCRPCNSDKRDLLLHEWATDRARLGKPPVRTSLDRRHPAFAHLLPDALTSGHAA